MMGMDNRPGLSATDYAEDLEWWGFTGTFLPLPPALFITNIDAIRYRVEGDVLHFAIVEYKNKQGVMKTHQSNTYRLLDTIFRANNNQGPLKFNTKYKQHQYQMKYHGFYLCRSFNCNGVWDEIHDLDGQQVDNPGQLLTTGKETMLEAVLRTYKNEFLFLVRRYSGEWVDPGTALILRAMAAVIDRTAGKPKKRATASTTIPTTGKPWYMNYTFHGLHLLEFDNTIIQEGRLWWNGKESDLDTVVRHLSFTN